MSININGLKNYNKSKNKRICIGTFDGFHKGHQKLTEKSDFLVTFDPHPKNILTNNMIKRLTTIDEQQWFFPNQIVIEFNKDVSKMTADEFLNDVILKYLAPTSITVGYDFKFGVNGSGNTMLLKEWGQSVNCEINVIQEQCDRENTPYKSSLIRQELLEDPAKAIDRLGHPYLLIGTVIDGEKRGRELGFPTANLKVAKNKCIPKFGVYKSHVIINNNAFKSISYIGRKPSFAGTQPSIETHILNNFNQTIYHQKIHLFLEAYLRDEQTFNSKSELINQIQKDIQLCS